MLLAGFAALRLGELVFSTQHQVRLCAEGATKLREPLYPLMITIHFGLFVGSPRSNLYHRPFILWIGGTNTCLARFLSRRASMGVAESR